MAVRLSDMKAKVTEATAEWDGEMIDFAYKPNEFTMELADEIAANAEKEDLSTVSGMLAPIVVWWDVLDDEDGRIPPTAENMRQFPLSFLMAIMKAINTSQAADSGESKG